jgi:hypothetical protein
MSFTTDRLYSLLPAIYRIRDAVLLDAAEAAEYARLQDNAASLTPEQKARLADLTNRARGPLKSLLMVLAEQVQVLEENLAALYDDQFIETCADWAVPYVGDIIGYQPLHELVPEIASSRAEVAHTIAYRRRKGTASMLEQLARDVTGWNARAVEFFQLLATTQYMNHLRREHRSTPDLRRWEPLQRLNTAFDSLAHTADVRRIASGRGRHNIPNVGLFLWSTNARSLTRSPAVPFDAQHHYVSPLGHPVQLLTLPETEDEITHLAEPLNVPAPISRRVLAEHLADYYGPDKSLVVYRSGVEVPIGDVCACDLRDDGATWAHTPPAGKVAVDPVLGRIALGTALAAGETLTVTFHYGSSADIGGGEYERQDSFSDLPAASVALVPSAYPTIQAAIDSIGHDGVVEIEDSGRYDENLTIHVPADKTLELRARNNRRPILRLTDAMRLTGGARAKVVLNGLLIAGHRLEVPAAPGNELRELILRHSTLVPGWTLDAAGHPAQAGKASLVVEIPNLQLSLERSISGPLHVHEGASTQLRDSILDANSPSSDAYVADTGGDAGGDLTARASTVIGLVRTRQLTLACDCILLSPVFAPRRQTGCVRFSYLPLGSRVPRRYRCQPTDEAAAPHIAPSFASLCYGAPEYAQLRRSAPLEITRGADDEGEMGAFHHLYRPQREANLRIRLTEYLRVGLEAGVLYET